MWGSFLGNYPLETMVHSTTQLEVSDFSIFITVRVCVMCVCMCVCMCVYVCVCVCVCSSKYSYFLQRFYWELTWYYFHILFLALC